MTKFRMATMAAALAATLTASQTMAAEGPLPPAPGKPAGVQLAQHSSHLLLIGGVALVTVIAVVVATQSSSSAVCGTACAAPSTSS